MYFALTLWKLPTIPRLKIDQNPCADDVLAGAVLDRLVRIIGQTL
jgi:hypothetical protein